MSNPITGGCLCGAVRYEVSEAFAMTADCFCTDCRKSSGTGHGTHCVSPAANFALNGKTTSFDKPADSGNIVTRHFCGTCGSAVYSTNNAMPGMTFVRASSLDDPEHAQPAISVYTSSAPSWDPHRVEPSFARMPPDSARPAGTEA